MEKKEKNEKRFRPTLREYRELEEVVERHCEELRGWKEQYRGLEEKLAGMDKRLGEKDVALDAQRKRIRELEKELEVAKQPSNKLGMENERLKKDLEAEKFHRAEADKQVNRLSGENTQLKEKQMEHKRHIVNLRKAVEFYETRDLFDRIRNVKYCEE